MKLPFRTSATDGAKAALDGFHYQLDVSVLVALQLMLIMKSATRITLEPANKEDLEVDLEPTTPGRVQAGANMAEGYKLVAQVKLRNSGPWSINDFDALLKHGSTRRPAKHHLEDPSTRYLLITNADASGRARNLLVSGLEEWPEERNFPASLSKTLPHGPEGRIAMWCVLTERLLDLEVNDILGSLLRVPQNRQAKCRARLRDEALQRMRGKNPGVWTREDLLSVIRGYGGYLASAPQLESFVEPANYQDLKDILQRRNAIVITGPSGTGKTWTARALVNQAQQQPSPPEIIEVNVNNGPSSMRMLFNSGPKLFYVEDPWGQYSLWSGADSWTEQLPRILNEARAEYQYVITSRTDMLAQARADRGLERWTVVLDADQYRDGELAAIYDKRLDLLATNLQAKALNFRPNALEALETPFEVDLFFTHMADGPQSDEVDAAFFRRVLGLAHRDAVENVVVSYLSDSDQTGASAIVWAVLAARTQFDRSQLVSLNRQLRKIDPTYFDGLEKLVNRLVATRHLRQPSQTISFSHPSVRAGFEMYIKEHWGRSEFVLKSLISALTQLGESQREWALETAARSLKAIADLISSTESLDAEFEADSTSHRVIDAWLEESLVDPRVNFGSMLRLASDVGTKNSTLSELARWFIKGIRRVDQYFLDDWVPPNFDDTWYSRVSADSRSFTIADRFVREQLPHDWGMFDDNFLSGLDRIATGLTPAFVAAARKIVASDYSNSVNAIAAGAVRNLDCYKEVLDAALNELASIRRSYERKGREEWRRIEDGEFDEAVEIAHQLHYEDRGINAATFVATYVKKVRSLGQWQSLAEHSRKSELGRDWAVDILRSSRSASLEELRAVIDVTRLSDGEDTAWKSARKYWRAALASDIEKRILSNPSGNRLPTELIYCALVRTPNTLTDYLERTSTIPAGFVLLLVEMHEAHLRISSKKRARRLQPLMESIPSVGKEIFEALSINNTPPRPVDQKALSLLNEAAKTLPPYILAKIVPVLTVSGSDPSVAIHKWLVETDDHQLAKAAVEAAIRIEDDALVGLALDHARADARVAALAYLAKSSPDPIPQRLLKLALDPGSRVRRTLVEILEDRPHRDHLKVLLSLVEDKWSDAEAIQNFPPSYPIARGAVAGIAAYGKLSDDIGEVLLFRAEHTNDRSLRIDTLNTAAKCCSSAIRNKIWALSSVDHLRWVRVDAIDALTEADVVESEILDEITATLVLLLPPPSSCLRLCSTCTSREGRRCSRNDGANCTLDREAGSTVVRRICPRRPRTPSCNRIAVVA